MDPFGGYFVYILANRKYGPIYVGVTGNLIARTHIHREDILDGFSSRYKNALAGLLRTACDPIEAITRQKRIKKWLRPWKIRLIEEGDPEWRDPYPDLLDSPGMEIPAFAEGPVFVWSSSPLTHP